MSLQELVSTAVRQDSFDEERFKALLHLNSRVPELALLTTALLTYSAFSPDVREKALEELYERSKSLAFHRMLEILGEPSDGGDLGLISTQVRALDILLRFHPIHARQVAVAKLASEEVSPVNGLKDLLQVASGSSDSGDGPRPDPPDESTLAALYAAKCLLLHHGDNETAILTLEVFPALREALIAEYT
ncbi:MAG: hypothetical protein KIT74_11655 [Fimbriimonadales bacterium]|nr:hypothetical protein [Fimbriimonadales bacterium]